MLIYVQRPDATRVAGFKKWQSLGRSVRRGEKGLAILAPCIYKRSIEETVTNAGDDALVKVLTGFRVVHVFDTLSRDLVDCGRKD